MERGSRAVGGWKERKGWKDGGREGAGKEEEEVEADDIGTTSDQLQYFFTPLCYKTTVSSKQSVG